MKEKKMLQRFLSAALAVCLALTFVMPATAVTNTSVKFNKVDNSAVTDPLDNRVPVEEQKPDYANTDVVRVSIVLSDKSTLQAGYSTKDIASNTSAINYRNKLNKKQQDMTLKISGVIGQKLDVVWNLTLAANIISANVKYGQIGAIEKIPGVKEVLIETLYFADTAQSGTADPNMATSGAQIGSAPAWGAGYTGAGSKIAIIDTGVDAAHQSFDSAAFDYALAELAEKAGMTADEYIASLNLMDADDIAAVADQLNADVDAASAYINTKFPYGFNYVDADYDISHMNDNSGEHGSHVTGIAAANRYIPNSDGSFSNAINTVFVQGVAPDAQIIVMKVFGKNGGAYDSDYMVAIEDAIILGCDSVNLSLGSGNPGSSRSATAAYQQIMENLVKSDTVVTMSAGNSGSWVENANNLGYLYSEDVSMHTSGSPGTFTNSLGVASVDNDGAVGYYVSVGSTLALYGESLEGQYSTYTNEPMSTLAGEQEFVMITGLGTEEDWAAVADVLPGKIGLCFRGEISFYEKAENAVAAGAIATIVCNNEPGIIYMDLSDYTQTAPAVTITQADAYAIMAEATPVTDEAGNVLYYTGTMTVSDSYATTQYNSPYYTMSVFSSWGVPGKLEMKPEITAPGGNIYSVWGSNAYNGGGTDQYELMSGTSMAAPQVTGMAAVVAQYIRENGLDQKVSGLTVRALAQSLLMSTAVPMVDGNSGCYYPILQQGAGLANVGAAIMADSYILMGDDATASWGDGKVKVELGDDPDRKGEYTFSFSINNLDGNDKAYTLSADFFIQAPFQYYANGNMSMDELAFYMDTMCTFIGAETTFTVDGQPMNAAGNINGMDFNGDGAVDTADGQALLDYATGALTELTNADLADQDGDGDIDSYDAYLFLSQVENAFVVPADGSVDVTVTVTIPADWAAVIDYYYPNGTYIEGYVFAEGVSSTEGVQGTSHSIPVLGFYGNWSDPSMYDVGSRTEYMGGEEYKLPYLGDTNMNSFFIHYEDLGSNYYFGGNPVASDAVYMPERNAISAVNGDYIGGVQIGLIRNAASSKYTVVNKTTGETYVDTEMGAVDSAYYYVNGSFWQNTYTQLPTQFDPTGINEGDELEITLTMAPEYYVTYIPQIDENGFLTYTAQTDWDALGQGVNFGMSMVVDNTAPEVSDISVSITGNTLDVTAKDNEYVAGVILYNKSGSKMLSYTGAKENIGKDESAKFSLDLTGINGEKFIVQVMDYAMNTTTYVIEAFIGEGEVLPGMIAFDMDFDYWTTFTKDTEYDLSVGLERYAETRTTFTAATIVDHMVMAADINNNLYIMAENDLETTTLITNLGVTVTDMAYNAADGQVYGVAEGYLVTIDKLTGELGIVGQIGVLTNTLACDKNGTFYCNGYGTGNVYSFTLDTIAAPEIVVADIECEGEALATSYIQAMEIDPNSGMLCWNSYFEVSYGSWGYGMAYYIEVDPKAGTYTVYNDLWDELSCLIIPEKTTGGGSWTAPTDEVVKVELNATSANMLKGGKLQLSASVLPWTASDRTVTWTSADETVAVVNENGMVTAVGAGHTVITATSNLDPAFSASCTISVEVLDVTINGMLQDEEGVSKFFSWNMATDNTWTGGAEIDKSMSAAAYNKNGDYYYVVDSIKDSWSVHKVGADGVTIQSYMNSVGVPLWDMEYSNVFSSESFDVINGIYAYYLLPAQDPTALNGMAFDMSGYGDYLTAITSMGYEEYVDEETGEILDTEHLVMMDNYGTIYNFWIFPTEEGMSAYLSYYASDLDFFFSGYSNQTYMYCSMVVGEDGCLYLSAFTGDTNELYRLSFDESEEMYKSELLGNVGMDVWPAIITEVTSNSAPAEADAMPKATEKMDAAPISEAEMAAVQAKFAAKEGMNEAASINDYARTRKAAQTVNTEKVTAPEIVLNSFKPGTTVAPLSGAVIGEGEATVAVTITAKDAEGNDVASTNGVATVTYDPEALTLVGAVVNGDYTSKVVGEGTVTIGYVEMDAFAAGDTVATLIFEVKSTDVTSLIVTHDETNDANPGYGETVALNYEHANTELRGAKAATCTEPGYTGDVYCADCGKLIAKGEEIPVIDHVYEETVVEPTPESDGYTEHTCKECGHSYKDSFTEYEDPDNADTGDSFAAMLWIPMLAVSTIGAAVLVLNRKKLF